jgi:hypothetical protein
LADSDLVAGRVAHLGVDPVWHLGRLHAELDTPALERLEAGVAIVRW